MFGADRFIFVETGRKTWRGVNFTPPPPAQIELSNIHRGHNMVFYFKEKLDSL